MTITLRPYQNNIIENVRSAFRAGERSQLIVSPTGSGKTVMFSYMASAAAAKGLRTLIIAHRVELLDQISRTLRGFHVQHGIIAPNYLGDRRHSVQVASVFAMARRLDRYEAPDLIIVDEAHHAIKDSTWGNVIEHYPKAKVLGVTATPIRLSGEGLDGLFGHMVMGPTVRELIEQGSLSPYRLYAPPGAALDLSGIHSRGGDYIKSEISTLMQKPQIVGSAVTHYKKLADGKRAVAFCCSVEHAEHVAAQFRSVGIPAQSIDGTMDKVLRSSVLKSFEAGDIRVLTSCDLISEGFDVPAIEVAILLRPTKSLGLYLQQVGRSLRTHPGKAEAIILDHVNAVKTHGLPDDERDWSLKGRGKKQGSSKSEVPVKQCPKCFATVASLSTHCLCGHEFEVKAREVDEVEGELVAVDLQAARVEARREQGRAQTEEDLVAVGRARGMKRPELWARHVIRARMAKEARA